MDELILYTDGAARGNPGPAAVGVQICRPDGAVVEAFGEAIGQATNNVAEYKAIIRALERARALGARRITLRADSELAVRQLTGRYQVRNEGLLPLFRQARRLLASFQRAAVEHIPRERNRAADALANEALNQAAAALPASGGPPPVTAAALPASGGPPPATAAALPASGGPPPATAAALRVGASSRQVPFLQVDAFTTAPFGGNPAGVVPDAAGLTEVEMQAIAREMNLSETAFVLPPEAPGADFRVRFFTPLTEVDLCGHATVATFWALAEMGRLAPPAGDGTVTVRQETRAGVLAVEVRFAGGRPVAVMMSQAAPSFRPFTGDMAELAAALGLPADAIAGAGAGTAPHELSVGIAYTGLWHLLVPVTGLRALERLAPDMARLGALNETLGVQTTHVFTLETLAAGHAAHARSLAPVLGIGEDPQTGTASGALGAYLVSGCVWDARLAAGWPVPPADAGGAPAAGAPADASAASGAGGASTVVLTFEQGHFIGRPGEIRVEIDVDGAGPDGRPVIAGVRAGGPAVIVIEGAVRLAAG